MSILRSRKSGPPPVAKVDKPSYPWRQGVAAESTAILVFVAMMCIFQYWLLTSTVEAYHAGDHSLPIGAFFASLGCFIVALGLTLASEAALLKQQHYLRRMAHGRASNSTIVTEQTTPPPTPSAPSPAARVQSVADAAGGGEAG